MPTDGSRRDKRFWASTVSKAEVESKSSSAAEFSDSAAERRSLKTLKRVVSVLRYDLTQTETSLKCHYNQDMTVFAVKTTFSKTGKEA